MFLPAIAIHPDNNREVLMVKKAISTRTQEDVDFYRKTDASPSHAFDKIVDESVEDLNYLISQPHVFHVIMILKLLMNRARPQNVIDTLHNVLSSTTANTPAYPAGHAFQAYYLAHKLGQKYPELKQTFNRIAKECDVTRVKAGLHYPSDGAFAKQIVDFLIALKIY